VNKIFKMDDGLRVEENDVKGNLKERNECNDSGCD
jgi:hypothetical protein